MKKSNRSPTKRSRLPQTATWPYMCQIWKKQDLYSNVLGFKLLKRTDEQLVYGTGKITIYIVKDNRVIPFIPALEVGNYEKAKQYIMKNGCRISKEWPEDRALYFEDPFGITIDIVEK